VGLPKIRQSVFTYFCTKQFFMEHSAFINLELLSQEARKELETFYDYLLFKYRHIEAKETKHEKFGKFLSKTIIAEQFEMPDREERNER